MSITVHYIDEEFNLHNRMLHVKLVRNASHATPVFLNEFKDCVKLFSVLDDAYEQMK